MNFITSLLGNLNYGTILFLMLLESTVVPVPSEFVVTPAAYHAASGQLDVWLVILFATIGADLGASINFCQQQVGQDVSAEPREGGEVGTLLRRSRHRGHANWTTHSWHPSPHIDTCRTGSYALWKVPALHHDWCRLLARHTGWTGLVSTYHRP